VLPDQDRAGRNRPILRGRNPAKQRRHPKRANEAGSVDAAVEGLAVSCTLSRFDPLHPRTPSPCQNHPGGDFRPRGGAGIATTTPSGAGAPSGSEGETGPICEPGRRVLAAALRAL
jgi:hypothetical protein